MSFEDAVRTMLDAPEEAIVNVEIEGGGEVQIGDCTWETEPTRIVVSAYLPPNLATKVQQGKVWERTFATIPDLWAALEETS